MWTFNLSVQVKKGLLLTNCNNDFKNISALKQLNSFYFIYRSIKYKLNYLFVK